MKAEDNYKCIEFNEDGSIKKIEIDSLEMKNISDIFDVISELHDLEKECNITCTLNSIKISKL